MKNNNYFFVIFFLIAFVSLSCEKETQKAPIRFYSGPLIKANKVINNYTDSGKTVMTMRAPAQMEFSNGDREFPNGLEIEFYNKQGKLNSTLKADYVHYNKNQELYTGTGNVVIVNKEEKQTLYTDFLHWSRLEHRIFTNRFVKIITPDETLTGYGLTSQEDFSSYKILKPSGTIPSN